MTSQEINVNIAEWLGWKYSDKGYIPDFYDSDADAITLLPVLAGKGWDVDLLNDGGKWLFIAGEMTEYAEGETISQAICAAILELIEKGEGK